MKICIRTDLEGVSGVASSFYINAGEGRPGLIAEARKMLAADINACIEGCVRAGADKIIVKDGHGGGFNVMRSQIDSRAELLDGRTPGDLMPATEGADGVIFLGYHAMAGTYGAVCEHTMNSSKIQNVWLNGRKVGEIGLCAAVAAEKGIPVVMVSGDDKTCIEAAEWIPGVVTCQVKKGFSCDGAMLPPLKYTHQMIIEKTMEALGNIPVKVIPVVEYPVTLRIELVSRAVLPENPRCRIIDARTCEVTADTVAQAWNMVN
ncbi:MAG: M55 family metallopeptidase [Lentisphaeria bacterium]|nr:M55 family metallopeptidase [Lentisphaeria bacterium]